MDRDVWGTRLLAFCRPSTTVHFLTADVPADRRLLNQEMTTHPFPAQSKKSAAGLGIHLKGLTLVELVTTMAIASVLVAIAIPSFSYTIATNRLATAANDLITSMNQARIEAIRRNNLAQFCSNVAANNTTDTLGTACSTNGGAAYVINSAGTATKVQDAATLPASVSLGTDGIKALRYNGQGLGIAIGGTAPYTGLVADLTSSQISTKNHRCLYLTTGSIVSSCVYSSACPSSEPSSCQ